MKKNLVILIYTFFLFFFWISNSNAYVAYDWFIGDTTTNLDYRFSNHWWADSYTLIYQNTIWDIKWLCLDLACTQKLNIQDDYFSRFLRIPWQTYPSEFLTSEIFLVLDYYEYPDELHYTWMSVVNWKYKLTITNSPTYYFCMYDSLNGAQTSSSDERYYVWDVTADANFICPLYNNWYENINLNGTGIPPTPTCDSENDPSCFCSNTLVKSWTDFTYYPYTFTWADLVVTWFLWNSLEIRPPWYNFFTQPNLLAKFNFSNVDTDANLSWDFYPNSFFVGTWGTYDTTGLIDSFSESRLNFQTFYFGTGSSYYYYSTWVTVANSWTLAFDYVKIHGLNNDTVDLEYVSIEQDFNGKEYGEVKRIYDVRTGDYIRLPRPTRSIKIILKPDLYYYIPKIEVGYYVPVSSFVEECTYVSPEDIENINWLDWVWTSQALSDIVKEQMEQDALEAFKFDNPILNWVYQKMVWLFVKIGLNNLVQLIKITVPQEPVQFINMPRLYISWALIWVEDSTLDIVVLENDYDVSWLLPESPYAPFFIGLLCTVFWIVYLSIIVSVVFFWNSFLISFIDWIVTRFFWNSVLNSNWGNIFSLFTTASWLFFIGKALITILSFVNFIFPILTYWKNLLLGILTIVTLNLWGYTTFATLSNWILYTIVTWVLVYSMMLAGKAYLKLN